MLRFNNPNEKKKSSSTGRSETPIAYLTSLDLNFDPSLAARRSRTSFSTFLSNTNSRVTNARKFSVESAYRSSVSAAVPGAKNGDKLNPPCAISDSISNNTTIDRMITLVSRRRPRSARRKSFEFFLCFVRIGFGSDKVSDYNRLKVITKLGLRRTSRFSGDFDYRAGRTISRRTSPRCKYLAYTLQILLHSGEP